MIIPATDGEWAWFIRGIVAGMVIVVALILSVLISSLDHHRDKPPRKG